MTDTRDREGRRSRGPTTRRRVLESGAGLVVIVGVAGVAPSSAGATGRGTEPNADEAYAQGFLEDHHEQLVFGTDFLAPDQEVPQFELFDRFELSMEAWANIRYRNLEGLLR